MDQGLRMSNSIAYSFPMTQQICLTQHAPIIEAQALFKVLTTAGGHAHFGQAADTPFVKGPVADNKIGPSINNDYCTAILDGTFNVSGIEEIMEVQDIIHGIHYPNPSNPTEPIATTITMKSFSNAIKNTREHTSSSPSGAPLWPLLCPTPR